MLFEAIVGGVSALLVFGAVVYAGWRGEQRRRREQERKSKPVPLLKRLARWIGDRFAWMWRTR